MVHVAGWHYIRAHLPPEVSNEWKACHSTVRISLIALKETLVLYELLQLALLQVDRSLAKFAVGIILDTLLKFGNREDFDGWSHCI